ncbi:MAG TPA: hypothetical protein VJA94_19300 [Candidatus Angelobacter sp.]
MKSAYSQCLIVLCVLWIVPPAPAQSPAKHPYIPHVVSYDASRLSAYSTTELIDLLSRESIEKNAQGKGIYSVLPVDRRGVDDPPNVDPRLYVQLHLNDHAVDYALSVERELASRHAYRELIAVFKSTEDEVQQAWVIDTLSQMRSPEVDAGLRRFISEKKEERSYLALKYFSLACDPEALRILTRNYFQYSVSSEEWATIVRSFGQCKYKPATARLVETVDAMMIDLGYASHQSLLAIYPDAGIEFRNPLETQEAWRKYLRTHH